MDISGIKKLLFGGITIDTRSSQGLQTLGYTPPNTGVPDAVKAKIDGAVEGGLKKIWRGMVQVAASGFGKGVLLAAALVIGGLALANGYMAFAGVIHSEVTGAALTVDSGVKIGIGKAIAFLSSGLGLATLGLGGALGAVADARKHQNKISAEEAAIQARQFERARSREQEKIIETVVPKTPALQESGVSYAGYKQPTNGKAAQSVASALALQTGGEECDSFCQREEDRRAMRDIVGRAF